jgi:hypothetical protein
MAQSTGISLSTTPVILFMERCEILISVHMQQNWQLSLINHDMFQFTWPSTTFTSWLGPLLCVYALTTFLSVYIIPIDSHVWPVTFNSSST